jgi:sugar phosphate isomerase/epimerase
MRLSCLPVSFFGDILSGRMSIREWARCARAEGLDSIDISILFVQNHTPAYMRKLSEELACEDMPIAMITTYPDFTHPSPGQREREMEFARHDIAIAAALGARYLRILAGQAHPQTTVREGIAWAVDCFARLDDVAARHGVILLYENHSKPGAWDLTDFSHPTSIFLEILSKISNTGIRVNFDTCNTMAYGDDPMPVLEEVLPKLETIHAADTARKGEFVPVVIGTGAVPFAQIFSRLKRAGFDGWICIEEASRTGKEGLSEAVRFIRSTWASA